MISARRRRRIWSEFVGPEELGSPATVALLRRYQLEPLVALTPEHQTGAMAKALRALHDGGVSLGLWPLLPDENGYWASEGNATDFAARTRECLGFAQEAGAQVSTLAVDLEPPLEITRSLASGDFKTRRRMLSEHYRDMNTDAARERREQANAAFGELASDLRDRGVESIAPIFPPVVLDLASGTRLWQSLFQTPTTEPEWAVVSPMMYTPVLASLIPAGRMGNAHVLLYEAGKILQRHRGAGSVCLSLGMVAPGKLGDEPHWDSPDALRRDVEIALATGIDDLALFSLCGVLKRETPERWLEPFTAELTPRAPGGVANTLAAGLIRILGWSAMRFARRRERD